MSGAIYGVLFVIIMLNSSEAWDPMLREEGLKFDFGLMVLGAITGGIIAAVVAVPLATFTCLVYYFFQSSRKAPFAPFLRMLCDSLCGAACGAISVYGLAGEIAADVKQVLMVLGAAIVGGFGGACASVLILMSDRKFQEDLVDQTREAIKNPCR